MIFSLLRCKISVISFHLASLYLLSLYMASCLSHKAGYWCTRSINASPIVVLNLETQKLCKLYLQMVFGANTVFGTITVFGMNTFSPQIYWGVLPWKNVWTVSPHIYRGFSFGLAIFTTNLHLVCQPICNAKSRRYRSENASRCVCHELNWEDVMTSYANKRYPVSRLGGIVFGSLILEIFELTVCRVCPSRSQLGHLSAMWPVLMAVTLNLIRCQWWSLSSNFTYIFCIANCQDIFKLKLLGRSASYIKAFKGFSPGQLHRQNCKRYLFN